jgi:maltooligosyltrehalose trehalohydrolase
MSDWRLSIGARPEPGGVRFRVWAPGAERVDVVLYGPDADALHRLEPEGAGYFSGRVEAAGPGTRYRYRLDEGETFPDPASRSQPDGVHEPSEVVDPDAFEWRDGEWSGRPLEELTLYELHVGTFTAGGTFESAVERLDSLVDLGVGAIEVMPIAGFPGARNWGYDGVNLFAPDASYGGPEGFKRLVDAAHRRGLAVVLDVVYNHLGPEGNYLPALTGGRFFTDLHHTPWGQAVNFDGPDNHGVRDFVLQNALYWATEYHVDGLRLDATHAILDDSPKHVLQEIAERLHALPYPRVLIAEDERNERRLLLPREEGGLGLDGVWADDLHHQLRRRAAGDSEGYFAAYSGSVQDIATTLRRGWFYDGTVRAPEAARPEPGPDGEEAQEEGLRGTPTDGLPPQRFVHCIQNHDQVGNRALGDRLNHAVPLEVYRALSTLLLVSPYTPLLWMGQEWAASSPFLYFTDHPDELGRLVTEGRREEFRHFSAFRDPEMRERIPDPQAEETFRRSRLVWEERETPPHAGVLALYRTLLRLRREEPALKAPGRDGFRVLPLGEGALALRRPGPAGEDVLAVVNFEGESRIDLAEREETRPPREPWQLLLASEEIRFGGTGGWGRLEPDGVLHLMGPAALLLKG